MACALSALAVLSLLAGCATRPPANDTDAMAAYEEANDPLEPMNRYFFEVNRALDELFLRPIAEIYRGAVPDPIQDGIRNALNNWSLPLVFANDLLQGEIDRAGQTFGRFTANTFLGLGGILDVASFIEPHEEDFGQTLAVWGVDEGPYLVLPLLGPSNPRDTLGTVVEFYADPVNIVADHNGWRAVPWVRRGLDVVDSRARNIDTLDEIERTAIDFYATIRSLYRQRRANEISNGRVKAGAAALDYSFKFEEDDSASTVSAEATEKK